MRWWLALLLVVTEVELLAGGVGHGVCRCPCHASSVCLKFFEGLQRHLGRQSGSQASIRVKPASHLLCAEGTLPGSDAA